MATIFTRGSEWRKWDLHLHAPGTKLNDGYRVQDDTPMLEKYCQMIHESEVAVVAIADYFSLDGYFAVKDAYTSLYPDDPTLILPNLELRLPVVVNQEAQEINLHLIFRSDLTKEVAAKFLQHLRTTETIGQNRTTVTCADLHDRRHFESATVSLAAIDEAIKATFGDHAIVPAARQEHMLVIASAKGDGIRAGGSGIQRKRLLSDEIDKFSDAFFGNGRSREYFLDTNRLDTDELIAPRPVFDGCDAHSFEDLANGLGKHVADDGRQRSITWIKADPTYSGLLQTLIEPAERVAIQPQQPDQKEPYKIISKVRFSGTEDFPSEIHFNPNLNAIIGSRSSGKSALLAYIAHAVDPEETVRRQTEAVGLSDPSKVGPAAGFSWDDVSEVGCHVEWASGDGTAGRVIYIPQNSLYSVSEQPDEITKRIAPALFRAYPNVKTAFDSAQGKAATANSDIRTAIDKWFELEALITERASEVRDVGDKSAITAERDRLQGEIERVSAATKLSEDEVAEYQRVAKNLDNIGVRLRDNARELEQLSPYAYMSTGTGVVEHVVGSIRAEVTLTPSTVQLPEAIAARLRELKRTAESELVGKVQAVIAEGVKSLSEERSELDRQTQSIEEQNEGLIRRHESNEELSRVVSEHKKQQARLDEITKREAALTRLINDQTAAAASIQEALARREEAFEALSATFNAEERTVTDVSFGVEIDFASDVAEQVSAGFNRRNVNDYVKGKGDSVSFLEAQSDPVKFLKALASAEVALNKNYKPTSVASEVLTVTKEVRFTAELDSDIIGGFSRSSMTPGKQALFALTLILNESQEPWPLLIDQPEDDLDSRSIFDTIVPYMMERKKERQIIMVSHNANLVIGADSELVIVANRHGEDRKNQDGRTFEYFAGALEHSQPLNVSSGTALGRFGVREHACEILDGGEEAFRKRREKYKIRAGR